MIVRLPYNETTTYTTVAGGTGHSSFQQWSMNNIFDPNITGGGGQPRYHDQWSVVYRKYYVRKAYATIRVHITSATNDAGGYLFLERVGPNDTNKISGGNTVSANLEVARASNGKVGVKRYRSMGGGQSFWMTFKKTVVPAFDYEGGDRSQLVGVFGAAPAALCGLNVLFQFPQRTAALTFFVETQIVYETILMDPKMPAAS